MATSHNNIGGEVEQDGFVKRACKRMWFGHKEDKIETIFDQNKSAKYFIVVIREHQEMKSLIPIKVVVGDRNCICHHITTEYGSCLGLTPVEATSLNNTKLTINFPGYSIVQEDGNLSKESCYETEVRITDNVQSFAFGIRRKSEDVIKKLSGVNEEDVDNLVGFCSIRGLGSGKVQIAACNLGKKISSKLSHYGCEPAAKVARTVLTNTFKFCLIEMDPDDEMEVRKPKIKRQILKPSRNYCIVQ